MNDRDRERLISLLAAHERRALVPDDDRALRTLLEEDAEAAATAGGDRIVDRLLSYAATSELGENEFTRGVLARISTERRGEPFVRRVTQASRQLRTRPSLRSASTTWLPAWLGAACAALVLLTLALSNRPVPSRKAEPASALRTDSGESGDRTAVAALQPTPEPAAPVPFPIVNERPKTSEAPSAPELTTPAPPPPEVPSAKDAPKSTVTTLGAVERVDGPASVSSEPAREGLALAAGQTVETHGKLVIRMNDGTRLALEPDTSLRIGDEGKRLLLSRGALLAEVTKQPKGTSLVFETPFGVATVLGTTLRLVVERGSTRLDVLEGKVRLTAEGNRAVDVVAGQFAVAAAGAELKAKPIPDPRVTEGLRALYVFEEGKGRVIRDVSGVGTPLNLVARDENDLAWIPGGGLTLRSTTLLVSSSPASKIVGACRTSRAITVEAWIRPATVEKGTLRFVAALSGQRRESLAFGLGLHSDIGNGPTTYRGYLTTPKTTPSTDTMPELESSAIVPGLAHLVFTRSASGSAALYVDGQLRASGTVEGDFSNWSDALRVMIGDYSFEGIRPWLGDVHLLAFYNRALGPEEVAQNFGAGKRKYPARK